MADIQVERRRRPGAWPWIAGVLVVALAIWLFTRFVGDDGERAVESMEAPAAAEAR